jgi:acetamidase/formamidase
MKKIKRKDALHYEFNKFEKPILHAKLGEIIEIETEDAQSGLINSEDTLPTKENLPYLNFTPSKSNPMAGPIYIDGVDNGDVLTVEILEVIPESFGVTYIKPGLGYLSDSIKWKEITEPNTKLIKHLNGPSGSTRDGIGVISEKLKWNLKPFIGTIGVAPEREILSSTLGKGPWGGNLDCRDIKEGSLIYLNSYNKGGLLYIGDVHASQGDGEFHGVADETKALVKIKCHVIRNKKIPFVRIETNSKITALFCDKPLEEAVKGAIINILEWLIEEYGFTKIEAYLTVGINPDFRINIYSILKHQPCKSVSTDFTAGVEIPKSYLTENSKANKRKKYIKLQKSPADS